MTYRNFDRPEKSNGQKLKENLIFMTVACIFLNIIDRAIEFIAKPLRTPVNDDTDDFKEEKDADKRQARIEYYARISDDDTDPMYQFQLRHLTDVEKFRSRSDTPTNKALKDWYLSWKRGEVIDSALRWAPDVLLEDGESYNPAFIQYMKIQLDLHKKTASFFKRKVFSNTINKYYPELSSNLTRLERDLAALESLVEEEKLKIDLKEAIKTYGLPDDLADYLIENNAGPAKLKAQAQSLKEFHDRRMQSVTCICAMENKLTMDCAQVVDKVVTEFKLPAKVGLAYANKEITIADITNLVESMDYLCGTYGDDIYHIREGENFTIYDEFIDEFLKEYKAKKRQLKFK